mmetsp:Transcript_150721/g.420131  ORF Transcript_150721/g.420131 Transcript_150721/m.420131 type:complete len:239 (-) Transcript_150721:858-1574(-)
MLCKHLVHAILSHLAPGRPLAARDEGDAVGWVVRDDVVAGDRALVLGIGIHRQRPNAIPSRHDIPAPHLQGWREVLLALVDEVLDLVLGHLVVQVWLCLHISGAHQGVTLPRQEKEEGAPGGHHVDHAHVPWAVVWRQHDVRAAGAIDHGLDILAFAQLAQAVSEGTTSVDDLLGLDFERLGIRFGLINNFSTARNTLVIKEDGVDFRIIQDASTLHGRGERDGEVCARIVVSSLVED